MEETAIMRIRKVTGLIIVIVVAFVVIGIADLWLFHY